MGAPRGRGDVREHEAGAQTARVRCGVASQDRQRRRRARRGEHGLARGAAWIAVTYAFTVFVSVAAGSLVVAVVGLVVAALAAGLAWTIRSRQPRWASIVLLLWVILETIARLVMSPSPTAIIGVILTVVAVSSVRGAFKLAEHRSGGFSAKDAPDVFS